MKLHELAPAPSSRQARVRVGRGRGSRRGKTAGRGTKGAKSRGPISRSYEGGQIPLQMRLPKLPGFRPPNRVEFTVVNVEGLEMFEAKSVVDPDLLRSKGMVRKKGPVKVLARGELTKSLTVKAQAFSAAAAAKIQAAGGTTEIVEV